MEGKLVPGVGALPEGAWNRLAPQGDPFLSAEYLRAMEDSGSASPETGWQPLHLVVEEAGDPVAAAPLYVKSHSWGEYVFDHAWADAYRRAGGRYYPKLQAAVPFTPVPGSRLLARDAAARETLAAALRQTLDQLPVSSLHVTFCAEDEARLLEAGGFLLRRGVQYHWPNRGYRDFADFLETFRSAKKKMVRKEREQVLASGIELRVLDGAALDEGRTLEEFYPFYLATVDKRWGSAYLTRDFFRRLGATMRDRVVLVGAWKDGRLVGAALNLRGADALYGRLWGCLDEFRFLHFECCYYQAIDYAIRHGIPRVEAGAQGQHKLHRGYAPVWTWSAHLIRDKGLRAAVARFLEHETRELEEQIGELEALLPYRRRDEG
jgi:predicted N-acyltransferase